jgi:hypothetical protein
MDTVSLSLLVWGLPPEGMILARQSEFYNTGSFSKMAAAMFYFNIERNILKVLFAALFILNVSFLVFRFIYYETGIEAMIVAAFFSPIFLMPLPIVFFLLYVLQIRSKTMTFKEIEKENHRRGGLKFIVWSLYVSFFYQGVLNMQIQYHTKGTVLCFDWISYIVKSI